ncbi:MAG: radical SAM protein [Elusimicrobia bacterium]|nr:radical SAM protein [Elusimicrobiota bacterium]
MKQENTKVLLIASWTNSTKVQGYYLSPPVGLYRIKNWLKDKYDIEVLDPNVTEPVTFLKNHGYCNIFGFSPTKDNLNNDLALMRLVRKLYPGAVLVAGGVEATNNYQQIFSLKLADYVIFGEGEKALDEFIQNNPNINLPKSSITRQYSYETVLNQDELTRASDIDWRSMSIKEYWSRNSAVTNSDALSTNCINMYITNYCPQGCKFCSTTKFIREACPAGSGVVAIPPLKLVEQIRKVKEQVPETRTIYFHDDNACHHADNTIEWCNMVANEKIDITFVASSRMDHFKPDVMAAMKAARFRKLSIGVEAYSDSLLKKVRKGQREKDIDAFVKLAKEFDMPLNVNLMLCQPEATADDVKRTAEFCLRMLENKGNSVTAHPYIKAYSGSWYFDNWDLIQYSYITSPEIEGLRPETIRIPYRFLPRDKNVLELLYKIDYETEHSDIFKKMRGDSFLMSQYGKELCNLVLRLI